MSERRIGLKVSPEQEPSFGTVLRRLREAAGITQEELAFRAGLTPNAVGDLERGKTRRPYPHTVRSLADALGLSEDERASLLAAVPKREAPGPEVSSLVPASPVPTPPNPPTALLGRDRELTQLRELLLGVSGVRLLTLTGIGGVGKTRLAVETARETEGHFPDGVAFVDLAPLGDPALVIPTIASTLGLREAEGQSPREALRAHLRERRLLLVLDNFEHLLGAAAEVAGLIEACPGLVVLATSRAPLRVRGEHEYPVSPLALPASTQNPTQEDVLTAPSGRLLVERARAVSPSFALTHENSAAVASICWRLAGLPLALELAAAKVRFLDPATLLSRLDEALSSAWARDLPERQRTMRAALDWSHDLLSEPEKELFGRLSVFSGGFTLQAAEAVGAAGSIGAEDVLGLLGTLVEQSLVMAGGDERRYGMLEPVRQYALEKLEEGTEAKMVRRRHAALYLEVAEQAHPQLVGPRQIGWLDRLERENGNLRTAMRWLMEEGEVETAVRLAWALHHFWSARAYQREGHRYAEEALEKGDALSTNMRAKALCVKAAMSYGLDTPGRTMRLFEQSAALFRQAEDKSGLAEALGGVGFMALQQGEVEQAMVFLGEGLALYRELGDKRGISDALIHLGMVLLNQEDHARATRYFEEALALAREIGSRHSEYGSLYNLALMARVRGEPERALRLYAEGLTLAAEVGDKVDIAYCLERLADLAASKGEPERAARLFGASEALLEAVGVSLGVQAQDLDLQECAFEGLRSQLGETSLEALWAEGRAMTLEEAALDEGRAMPYERAVEYALEGSAPIHDASNKPATPRGKDVHTPSAGTDALRIFALGPAQVEKGGRPLDSPDWIHKPRELLFYLLSHPKGRTREQIGLALWPDASAEQLRSSFHDTVYRLRRALGGKEWIVFRKGRYALNRSLAYSFDVEAFEENLSEARRLRSEAPEQAIRHLQEVAGLYGGDFLEDSADGEWATARQEELQREYGEALLLLGGLLFGRGRHAEAADVYRKAVSHDPFLEEAHRGLMRCQAALGERGRALRHYEELVRLLDEQLGTPPAPETGALHERLRAGEEP